jgi:hypothetical protein
VMEPNSLARVCVESDEPNIFVSSAAIKLA